MKILFIADIHGRVDNLIKLDNSFDKLVVLGDVFGPSYDDNQEVLSILKDYQNKLILIRGNCDSPGMLNQIGVPYYDYYSLEVDGLSFGCLHGHTFSDVRDSIVIFGHKHYPFISSEDNHLWICVGSISYPRNESKCSYAIYENNDLRIIDINQNLIEEINL